jgi:DNA-binding transcriptional ArsR family regulator
LFTSDVNKSTRDPPMRIGAASPAARGGAIDAADGGPAENGRTAATAASSTANRVRPSRRRNRPSWTSHYQAVICRETAVTTYAALAEPHRRQILDLLRAGERPAGDLVDRLELSQPAVSKHLKVLRDAGLVAVRRRGRQRLYALRPQPLAEVDTWLEPYRAYWSERLDALERHLEENP